MSIGLENLGFLHKISEDWHNKKNKWPKQEKLFLNRPNSITINYKMNLFNNIKKM